MVQNFCEVWEKRLFFKSNIVYYMHALITVQRALFQSPSRTCTLAQERCVNSSVKRCHYDEYCSNLFVWLFVVIVSYTSLITHRRRKTMRVTKREDISYWKDDIDLSLSFGSRSFHRRLSRILAFARERSEIREISHVWSRFLIKSCAFPSGDVHS